MHKYQSHKVVEAGRITDFYLDNSIKSWVIKVEGDPQIVSLKDDVALRITEMAANANTTVNTGYLVQYPRVGDAPEYISWSPREPFEKGYVLVQPSSGKSKIAGYRELTASEIADMNAVKEHGKKLGQLIEALRNNKEFDQRWVAIGATDLQTGLMALTRAIAKPEFF